jgi:hypothetical protein
MYLNLAHKLSARANKIRHYESRRGQFLRRGSQFYRLEQDRISHANLCNPTNSQSNHDPHIWLPKYPHFTEWE